MKMLGLRFSRKNTIQQHYDQKTKCYMDEGFLQEKSHVESSI
jgi:hypothetical protein